MKAISQIGWAKSLKYLSYLLLYSFYRLIPLPPLRVVYLRLLGAKIGKNCVIHGVKFFNYYRTGFKGLEMGNECFIGDDCLLDLAAPIVMENQVTLAERVLILTHLNVGYADHPLQQSFPSQEAAVRLHRGCFIGAGTTLLHGVEIGESTLVGACSLVKSSVPPRKVVVGVPAKCVRDL